MLPVEPVQEVGVVVVIEVFTVPRLQISGPVVVAPPQVPCGATVAVVDPEPTPNVSVKTTPETGSPVL